MTRIVENPDGTRTFHVDEATAQAVALLEDMGADAPELTLEQFEELVEEIRRAWDEDDDEPTMTIEEYIAESKRLAREERQRPPADRTERLS